MIVSLEGKQGENNKDRRQIQDIKINRISASSVGCWGQRQGAEAGDRYCGGWER